LQLLIADSFITRTRNPARFGESSSTERGKRSRRRFSPLNDRLIDTPVAPDAKGKD
jgi:hypothetical protein